MSRKIFLSFCLVLLSAVSLGHVAAAQGENQYALERQRMVAQQLQGRDITDPKVLAAMGKVPLILLPWPTAITLYPSAPARPFPNPILWP